MALLQVDLDSDALRRQLTNLERAQFPAAAAGALNDVAEALRRHVTARMDAVFDRPTRFTKNAFRVNWATRSRLESQVLLRDAQRGKHFLKVQETGGIRPQTGLEKGLSQRLAYEGVIQSVVPTAAARHDAFGNWSGGERNQALSAIGAQRDPTANTTAASRKRHKKRANYFVPKKGLAPGVYRRDAPGAVPIRVLLFTEKSASYTPRLRFEDQAEVIWRADLPGRLALRLAEAVAAAR